jgi:hypothetical protein
LQLAAFSLFRVRAGSTRVRASFKKRRRFVKEAEDYHFLLDCWKSKNPDTDGRPAQQVGYNSREQAKADAEKLWLARKKNGYKYLVIYEVDADEEWKPVDGWPKIL